MRDNEEVKRRTRILRKETIIKKRKGMYTKQTKSL